MRQLKYHEQKLLKKVDFYNWKREHDLHEIKVMRRYHIQKREDYVKYNKLVGMIQKLSSMIQKLEPNDPFRMEITEQLLNKLYSMGLLSSASNLSEVDKVSVSAFARRRLPVILVKLKMAETLKEAVTFIEQGHLRVGPEVVTDPAFHCTRSTEDFVTWTDTSRIKRHVLDYSGKRDDFDLLQA